MKWCMFAVFSKKKTGNRYDLYRRPTKFCDKCPVRTPCMRRKAILRGK